MSRRMIICCLTAVCVLGLTAISASSALAGATAFTCVTGGGAANTNADCVPGSSGTSGHVAIGESTSTMANVNKLTNPVLTGKLFGANVELSATGVECIICEVENTTTSKGVMEVVGSHLLGETIKFTGVTVVGMETKCAVSFGSITTRRLKFATTSASGLTLEPESGSVLAEFDITGAECPVAGSNLKVTGKAAGTLSGAKMTVNVTKASGELQLEGEKAALKGEGTLEAGFSTREHPIALTTA